MDADQLRFSGFISYSHADGAFARALYARLCNYRLPRNATPQDQRRLGRFFIDRETMPATGSLSDEIISAIARSENLIVVCSPNAAASPWVKQEIEAFREHRPHGQILCAVIGGDPGVREGENSPYPGALLRGPEMPLAPDFRPAGDGFRLAFLKIAASLSGATVPALTRTDDARRSRRLVYATTLSGLVAAGMTVLAAYALSSRAEADSRKQAADNLVEFMMGDLRERLLQVGRLDVLEETSSKVVEHYAETPGQQLDCGELIRLGKAYDLATEVAINGGDPHSTRKFANAGLQTANALETRCARNPGAMFQTGHASFWAGYAALTEDDLEAADGHFRHYYEVMQKLAGDAPDNDEYRMEFAAAGLTLGTSAYQAADFAAAESLFVRSCAAYRALHLDARAEARHARNLANCHGWHSQSLVMQDRLDEAKQARELEIQLIDQLVVGTEKPNWTDIYSLASSHRSLARIHFLQSNDAEARRNASIARAYGEQLIAHDSENGEWLFTQARTVALLHEIAAREGSEEVSTIRSELAALSAALPASRSMSSDELIDTLQLR